MHAVIFTVQCSSQTCIKAVHRIINIMIPFFTFIFFFPYFGWGEGGGEDMSMKFKAWQHVVLIHLLTVISSF